MGIELTSGRNVLGGPLRACSFDPLTGFFRDGCCRSRADDLGQHVVCARVTQAFLEHARARGNDLITPRPEWRFAGLKPGDRWCLCTDRWLEAWHAGVAPPVVLDATHEKALERIPLAVLQAHAYTPRSGLDQSPAK
jgi:uncharacterized protein (DUF2237 family)